MDHKANIVDVFIRAAEAWPQQTALIHDGERITYAGLRESVQKAAGALKDGGICKGDAVLVAVPMSVALYTTILALFYIGAIPVFMDAWVGRKRMAECLTTVPCKGIIAPATLLWISRLFRALRAIPIKCTPGALLRGAPLLQAAVVAACETALITFTTGSTGPPKAANRTHEFLHAQLTALRPILDDGQTHSLTTLPIVVLLHLAMGNTTVLPPVRFRLKDPRSIRYLRTALALNDVATIIVSPSVIALLLQRAELPKLKRIVTGGGPVFPGLARQIVTCFPDAQSIIVFGSTEAEPVSHVAAALVAVADTNMLRESGLPVGKPDLSIAVRIIPWHDAALVPMTDAAFEKLCLKTGEAGEIVVSGAHVLQHYINNPAAEAIHKMQVNGVTWHRTGDAGRLDDSGQLYFLGRCTEIIHWHGRTIFPVIVASRLTEIAGISGAALLHLNDRLTVVLESQHAIREGAIAAALAEYGIAGAGIVRLKGLPRDPRHRTKVDYGALHKLLHRRYGR